MKKNLYLFRHGQSEANKNEKILGLDTPLTSFGIEQAKNIPQYLRNKNLGIIYSSPLQRARKTGEIVANALKIDIKEYKQLREAFFGDYEGRKKEEAFAELGEEFRKQREGNDPLYDKVCFPNGETKLEARQRMAKAVNELTLNCSFKNIGFSTHGFVLFQLFITCCGFDEELKGFKNCEILHLEFDTEKYRIDNPYGAFRFVERMRTDISCVNKEK